VVAAAAFLAQQPGVDPQRIYLGGHSTGGTLVLLTAEYSSRFRAVFAFGPIDDVRRYGGQFLPPGLTDMTEIKLRSPIYWLDSVKQPTFVFEGAVAPSNAVAVTSLQSASKNPAVHFYLIPGATHFSTLAPTNKLITQKILADTGSETNITFTSEELNALF
jgi:dienelactone hydrolase